MPKSSMAKVTPARASWSSRGMRVLRVGHDGALGDLEDQPVRRDAMGGKHVHHLGGPIEVDQDVDGQVDGDAEVEAGRPPDPAFGQGVIQDEEGELLDQPIAFRDGDELLGRQHPQLRMWPANEGLGRDDLAIRDSRDGLVVHLEETPVQGSTELPGEAQPELAVPVRPAVVHRDVVAGALRRVHRHVRPLEQGGQGVAVVRSDGDADAGSDVQHRAVQPDGYGDGGVDPVGGGDSRRGVGQIMQQDRELVPAQARHQAGLADRRVEPVGHLLQQQVAGSDDPGCR